MSLWGQPKCHIEHYDLIDGLPQRTVMSILQDSKGFMWFSTWDGLCRFDGYTFTSYKAYSSGSIPMKSSRINKIIEDKQGFIWIQNYYKETFCFDPVSEEYISSPIIGDSSFDTHDILVMPSGYVWIISQTMGALCITGNPHDYKLFNTSNSLLPDNEVHLVYEDDMKQQWILTNSGLVRYTDHEKQNHMTYYSGDSDKVSFFCAYETPDEIYFGANHGRIFCYLKKEDRFKIFDTGFHSDIIDLQKIIDNRLLALTRQDGFGILNNNKEIVGTYTFEVTPSLASSQCVSAYIDREKNIWIETDGYEVVRFDFLNNAIHHYHAGAANKSSMFSLAKYFIFEDPQGNVWVHPKGGGFSYYDKKTDQLKPFYNDPASSDWKFSNILHAGFIDNQGNMWLSTRSEGLEKIVFEEDVFKLNHFGLRNNTVPDYGVRGIYEDNQNRFWIGCSDGIIRIFNQQKEYLGFVDSKGRISNKGTPLYCMAYCFHQNSQGEMYIGTKGNGIYHLTPAFSNSLNNYRIDNYTHHPEDPFSLSSNNIYAIHEDANNRIWVGSYGGGLNLWDFQTKRFIHADNLLSNYPTNGVYVRHINSDDNHIYVGTTFGLIVFNTSFQNPEQINFKSYTDFFKHSKKNRSNDILNIYIDANDIYISTYGGGLNKITEVDHLGYPAGFTCYDTESGLPSDVILSVIKDMDGNLWVATEGCLSKYHSKTQTFETFSDVIRLLSRNYISECVPLLLHTGEIYFGCSKGTLSFLPSDIHINDYVPSLAITDLSVAGKKIKVNHHFAGIHEIHLESKENTFHIEYAALDYAAPFNIRYSYQLEGIDNEWIYNSKNRTVNYLNMQPGTYLFKVRSTNSNGNWVDNEEKILFIIHPSFWQTKTAYVIYFLMVILLLVGILYSIITFYRMKDKIALEEEQTELKTRFFTDISHEIRTPLTMIVSPIENIIENESASESIKEQLNLVLKNTNRILKMVNQILDFRKIQKKRIKLQQIAIGTYVTDLCNNFFKDSNEEGIQLKVSNQVGSQMIWADYYGLEKLIFNLVSNAIKYTPAQTPIEVSVFRKDSMIALQVRDEGEGMSKETMNKLFTRFESFNKDQSKPSSGIGLSIVKEVADKHHARITVESEKGRGSVFTVYFPMGMDVFKNDVNIEFIHSLSQEIETLGMDEKEEINEPTEIASSKLTILVVEDDADLRKFICDRLLSEFNVIEASNGVEGYEKTQERMPDFILSDIMMPEMDGISFLKKIRNSHDTSHIPVILLTAKSSIDDKLLGIESGADDYITKPFNVRLLKVKINSIIQQRSRFHSFLMANSSKLKTGNNSHEEIKISPQDEKFLLDIKEEVEKNFDNTGYLVEDLVATTIFSRKVFFKKLKSLTGLAPVEFIREVRLKRAAELILKGYYVKEVTYMVGFSDIKYFTKCFKKTYGVTPAKYREVYLESDKTVSP